MPGWISISIFSPHLYFITKDFLSFFFFLFFSHDIACPWNYGRQWSGLVTSEILLLDVSAHLKRWKPNHTDNQQNYCFKHCSSMWGTSEWLESKVPFWHPSTAWFIFCLIILEMQKNGHLVKVIVISYKNLSFPFSCFFFFNRTLNTKNIWTAPNCFLKPTSLFLGKKQVSVFWMRV